MKTYIFTIANNKQILDEFKKNINKQKNVEYSLIVINNYSNEYNGARIAYDQETEKVTDGIYIFCHPDIRFETNFALHDFIDYCEKLNDYGVIGVAGSPCYLRNNKRIIFSNIHHGAGMLNAGERIDNAVEVQTVDECFFAVKSDWFKIHPFDKVDGWHLYAVVLCLCYLTLGKRNYVVPAKIWHISNGSSLDPSYIVQLKRTIKKYKNEFPYINTTVKKWKTKGVGSRLYLDYYWMKQYVKKLITI